MGLVVQSLCYYLGRPVWLGGPRPEGITDDHYLGHKLAKAAKGEKAFKGTESFKWGEKVFTISGNDSDVVRGVFGEWVAARLGDVKHEVALVPIPPHDHTVSRPSPGAPHALAKAIAKATALAKPRDVLRWTEPMPAAHCGGPQTRDVRYRYDRLAVIEKVAGYACYLIDDVVTSGSQLRAAAARLRERGAEVRGAFCVGRTWSEIPLPDKPLLVPPLELQDYVPPAR